MTEKTKAAYAKGQKWHPADNAKSLDEVIRLLRVAQTKQRAATMAVDIYFWKGVLEVLGEKHMRILEALQAA